MSTTCEKRGYETEADAKSHLLWIVENNYHKNNAVPCRYYKCPKCKNYHLTSKPTVIRYGIQKRKEVDNGTAGKAPGVGSITPAGAISINR